jgi:hypothetical protein
MEGAHARLRQPFIWASPHRVRRPWIEQSEQIARPAFDGRKIGGVSQSESQRLRFDPSVFLQPDNHVDRRDAHAVGGGNVEFRQKFLGNIGQLFGVLAVEVVVRPGLGVIP